jgi:hypothetical protein
VQTRTWRGWSAKTLAPRLDWPDTWPAELDWQATGQVLAAAPTGWLAQGLAYSRSRSKERYSGFAWVMPLYIPFDSLALSWSLQLSQPVGGQNFTTPAGVTDVPAAVELADAFNLAGRPHLERVGTLKGFLERTAKHQREVLDMTGAFWHAEEVGYTLLLLGQYVEAAKQLERQRVHEADEDREWVSASRDRCGLVLDLLLQKPALAVDKLAEWAAQTAGALGLTWVRPS